MATEEKPQDDKPEEELTNEERMAWLRARGVVVEEAEGRRPAASGGATFKFVRIPMDESLVCEERTATKSAGDELLTVLGPEFASKFAGISDDALTAMAAQMGQSVGNEAMRAVLKKGGAETFRLASATALNGREAVYAYLDEASALKGLPKNVRASALALQCGFPASCALNGDIFIGRQKYAEGGMVENIDFTLAELEPGCLWLRRAPIENLEFQKETQAENHAKAQAGAVPYVLASGAGHGYTWRDEAEELEVEIPIEKGTTKKDVKVQFLKQEVRMTKPLTLSLKLFERIDVDGCNWTIGDGKVVLTLGKATPEPWPQLLA